MNPCLSEAILSRTWWDNKATLYHHESLVLLFLSVQWVRPEGGSEPSEGLVQSAAWERQPQESQDPEDKWVLVLLRYHNTCYDTWLHNTNYFLPPEFEVGASPICKDPLGWMFSRLDTNFDLQLDQSEIKSLYLDRNEPCSNAFFKTCDTHTDKAITSSEWCTCFQRYTGNVLACPHTHMQTCII